MRYMTRSEISESTGFDQGVEFESEQDVRDYFTVEAMESMGLGNIAPDGQEPQQATQDDLDELADTVIAQRWHCAF